jgi:hypothetical protein
MNKHLVKVGGTIRPKPGYSITSFRMPIPREEGRQARIAKRRNGLKLVDCS